MRKETQNNELNDELSELIKTQYNCRSLYFSQIKLFDRTYNRK